jgi:copper chaperone CopZ
MYIKKISILSLFLVFLLVSACNKSDNKTTENKDSKLDQQVTQVSGKEKSVVIQCSGMTCEGCKSSIEHKVKKVDGIKTVDADFKTNIVKATFDDGKTNIDAIKNAIVSAGYKVESVKE